jgi:hypothetical protein
MNQQSQFPALASEPVIFPATMTLATTGANDEQQTNFVLQED